MFYEASTLESGVNVITQRMEGLRSVALGLWVRVGSRDETERERGIAHFIEHMLFKGTPTRDAFDISLQTDALGAVTNAFTSRECTCFHARVIDEHLDDMFEILADMLLNACFDAEDLELERDVVLEEIARGEDTPEERVYDVFSDAFMPTHPLGRPVLGTRESVGALTSADLHAFHDAHYTGANVFVVAAGNVEHAHVEQLAHTWLRGIGDGAVLEREHALERQRERLRVETRDSEQAHVVLGYPSIACDDPARYAYHVLDTVMGGSMSSRLFREIREKRGLVYSVYTSLQFHEECGVFCAYAGTRPENLAEVLGLMFEQFETVAEHGIDAQELARAKELLRSSVILSMETPRAHMNRLGRQAVMRMPFLSLEETLERYEAVSREDVAEAAANLFETYPTVAVVSSCGNEEVEEMLSS